MNTEILSPAPALNIKHRRTSLHFFPPKTDVASALGLRYVGAGTDLVNQMLQTLAVAETFRGTGTCHTKATFIDDTEAFVIYMKGHLPLELGTSTMMVLDEVSQETDPKRHWMIRRRVGRIDFPTKRLLDTKGFDVTDFDWPIQLMISENQPLSYQDLLSRIQRY